MPVGHVLKVTQQGQNWGQSLMSTVVSYGWFVMVALCNRADHYIYGRPME